MGAETGSASTSPVSQSASSSLKLVAVAIGALSVVVCGVGIAAAWPDVADAGVHSNHLIAGGVCLAALVAQGFVMRHLFQRFAALSRVGEAMSSWADGEGDLAALRITRDTDPVSEAWNRVVDALQQTLDTRTTAAATGQLTQQSAGEQDGTLDALPHGVVIVNAERHIISANGAASRVLMRSRDRLVGAPLDKVIEDETLVTLIDDVLGTPDARGGAVELKFNPGEEQEAVMRATVRPVGKNASQRNALIVFEDVTQQRTADRSRNLFVAQATHELRTPLTNIGLYLERAIDLDDHETADRAECLNVINQEVIRLGRVVEEVLSVSEIEAGSLKVNRDDVRVDELIRKIEDEYRPQARKKNLALSFDLPPKLTVIQADREKVTLALHNLLGNALKYTPEGGEVRVELLEVNNELLVNVSDTGIGISEDEIGKVFEKFYRADDQRLAGIGGSGLGLALAREVIRLHGGDITLQSTLNQGSTFTLRLPVNATADAAA